MLETLRKTMAADVPGDVMEFGVFHCHTFMAIINIAEWYGRVTHAVDSFSGMAEPTERDGDHYPAGRFDVGGTGEIREKLVNFKESNYRIWEGYIPEILEDIDVDCVAFAHVDLDHYTPTLDTLDWLWPRISPGGVIVCHDYLEGSNGLATAAVDEFIENTSEGLVTEKLSRSWIALRKEAER